MMVESNTQGVCSSESIHTLRSQFLTRLLALIRIGWSTSKAFSSKESLCREVLHKEIQTLTYELGQLKGCVMKVGQTLATYGEHFLPSETNDILKTLHSQSQPLCFSRIEPVLKKELGPLFLKNLDINPQPIATASLGQVHKAFDKKTRQSLAIKVQYPGVEKTVENDLEIIKYLLSLASILPNAPHMNSLFQELHSMLHLELNYHNELKNLLRFRDYLKNDNRFIIPEPCAQLSTKKVLTMSYEEGIPWDSPIIENLSQKERNTLGNALLDLYFKEIFQWGEVQTDAHFGNFAIRKPDKMNAFHRIVLYDFGSVHRYSEKFMASYKQLTRSAILAEDKDVCCAAHKMGLLRDDEASVVLKHFCEFCYLIVEPFRKHSKPYEWRKSNLPNRLVEALKKLINSSEFRAPPQDMVFLERKVSGIFTCLASLDVKMNGSTILDQYLKPTAREKTSTKKYFIKDSHSK